jgi:hypothetical protein
MLGDGQSGQSNTSAGTRRFVHLAIDETGLVQNPGFFHLIPEVIALTSAFTHSGKHRESSVFGSNVADEFHDYDRLAHSCSTKEANLPTLGERAEQVQNLDPRDKHLR